MITQGVYGMAGFSKVFSTIWGGSLHGHFEASAVFLVFLSLADREGTVDMTPQAIAGTTGWPLDFILKGISELEAPDSKSRTEGHEGRRILPIDSHRSWGWIITNYALYRDKMRSADRTAYLAEKQREYRARQKSQGIKPKQYGVKTTPHQGFVYFIQAEDKVKIGFSVQPEERLATLKTGNPLASLIGFQIGTNKLEQELHNRFKEFSAGGEWFNFSTEIRDYIKSISPLYTSIQQVFTSTIINQDKPIADAEADTEAEALKSRFAEFWEVYPRKVARPAAEKAWNKIGADSFADRLIQDVAFRAMNDAAWRDKKFIPHASTYLNNERWTDEVQKYEAPRRNLSAVERVSQATRTREAERTADKRTLEADGGDLRPQMGQLIRGNGHG